MSRSFYSRIIREMRLAGVDELGVFYIGESFSCPWLPDAIAEAKAVGYPYVFLTTNGTLATPEKIELCMRAGLDSLKFSLNFVDEGQFAQVAHVKPSLYRRALNNIRRAREIRDEGDYSCGLYASSIAFDGEQGEKMKALVAQVAPLVDEHYWLPLYGMQGAAEAAGWKPQPGNPGRLAAMRDPIPCWSVFTEGHITAKGKLSACCFGNGADDELVMADLNETAFMDGWNSPAFQMLRAAHLAKDLTGTACAACAAG